MSVNPLAITVRKSTVKCPLCGSACPVTTALSGSLRMGGCVKSNLADARLWEVIHGGARSRPVLIGVNIDDVVRTYQAVGWVVEYVSDWRDGDFLQFKEGA